jgi:hypothetical protein
MDPGRNSVLMEKKRIVPVAGAKLDKPVEEKATKDQEKNGEQENTDHPAREMFSLGKNHLSF